MSSKSKKQIDPFQIMKTVIDEPRFSHIFEEDSNDDHFIYAKNNILIILLCFTVYSIYILFMDYLDAILLAVLSGVAYRQLRDRFIKIWIKDPTQQKANNGKTIFMTVFNIILFFLLPWIRYQSKKSFNQIDFSFSVVIKSFIYTTNPLLRVFQAYLLIKIIYSLFGGRLDGWFKSQRLQPSRRNALSYIFAVLTVIIVILMVTTVLIVFTIELGRAYSFTKKSIQNLYDCQFQAKIGSNSTLCAQKISGNLSFYMPKISNQTEFQKCIQSINNTELSYLGFDYFDYEENICTFEQYAKYISPNLIQSVSLKQTGQLLGAVKNVILNFINFFLDFSFSFSTFIAIFMVTIKYFEISGQHIYIFGSTKKNLVQNIANIISATVFIALQHLALGLTIFQIFRFTEINMILSIFLSIIAFIPLVKPSILVIGIAVFKIWLTGDYITSIFCALVYWYYSGVIYQKYYAKVDLHIVLINLSVIFGIYQYGVTGIFYGPLLILLFQCVYEELFRTKKHR